MTNEVKFTPGPWGVLTMGETLLVSCTGGERAHKREGRHIAYLATPGPKPAHADECLANARLIASAPQLFTDRAELLAMVQRLLPYAKDSEERGVFDAVAAAESLLARITESAQS
jgi:hypothetical protein